ncbi:MAG: hypothetical protein RIR00_1164 [Pseudomonadota bacterium]|jgi:hypothetical protein
MAACPFSLRRLFSCRPAIRASATLGLVLLLGQGFPAWAETDSPPDLAFRDLFRLPVGPKGLEPSAKLVQLNGQIVRMLGYPVKVPADQAVPGLVLLAPFPTQLGDEDDSLADDLPPQVVFVHGADLPATPGLLRVQGRLELGARDEADGHVSTVRILAQRVEAVPLPAASRPAQ